MVVYYTQRCVSGETEIYIYMREVSKYFMKTKEMSKKKHAFTNTTHTYTIKAGIWIGCTDKSHLFLNPFHHWYRIQYCLIHSDPITNTTRIILFFIGGRFCIVIIILHDIAPFNLYLGRYL